ncbi:MAG: hypothetical protein OXU20_42905 [Myxococcales bacterium]|nr:hypothetical protein [Myxococcales bacterium]MDD9971359.1 hypothetical protein [Myxococcales bacterium]
MSRIRRLRSLHGEQFRYELLKRDGRIQFRKFQESGREHYHLRIWLEAPADTLARITKVSYRLHPSFSRPVRTSNDREHRFAIEIWTWGLFEIEATAYFDDGSADSTSFYLGYELPEDDGHTYVDVG